MTPDKLLALRDLNEDHRLGTVSCLEVKDGLSFDFNAAFVVQKMDDNDGGANEEENGFGGKWVDTHLIRRMLRLRRVVISVVAILALAMAVPIPGASNSVLAGLIVNGVPVLAIGCYGVYYLTIKVRYAPAVWVSRSDGRVVCRFRVARWPSPIAKIVECRLDPLLALVASSLQGEPARTIIDSGQSSVKRIDPSASRYCLLLIGQCGECFLLAASPDLTELHSSIRRSAVIQHIGLPEQRFVDLSDRVVVLAG